MSIVFLVKNTQCGFRFSDMNPREVFLSALPYGIKNYGISKSTLD